MTVAAPAIRSRNSFLATRESSALRTMSISKGDARMRKLVINIVHPQVGSCVNLIVSEDNLPVVLQALVQYDFWGDIEIVEPMIVPE
jgi:hypothetical protein